MIHISSFHKPITNKNSIALPVTDIVSGIQEGAYKNEIEAIRSVADPAHQKELKSTTLPYVTFSAVMQPGFRDAAHVAEFTGLLCLDLADMDTTRLEEWRITLQKDPYTHILFLAPRGTDFKLVMRTEQPLVSYESVYTAARQYLFKTYGLHTDSTSDVSRACFISYDPYIYYNPNAQPFNTLVLEPEEVQKKTYEEIKGSISQGNRHTPMLELALKYANDLYKRGGAELLRTDELDTYIWGVHTIQGRTDRKDTQNIIDDAREKVLRDPPLTTTIRLGNHKEEQQKPKTEVTVLTSAQALEEADTLARVISQIPPIGISTVDEYVRFIPQELMLISADTHMGKTLYALYLAVSLAQTGRKVLYISLENGPLIVHTVKAICGGTVPENLYWYFPREIITFNEIQSAVEQQAFDGVFIDHLHFMQSTEAQSMNVVITNVLLDLQMMMRRKNMFCVALCHMRKRQNSKDDSVPTLADLKDSSSLSQIPAVVMILHRKRELESGKEYLSPYGTIAVAKNRFGKTGYIPYYLKDGAIDFSMQTNTTISYAQPNIDNKLDALEEGVV